MDRVQQTFARLTAQHKKILSPYITAGDPNPTITVPLMHALVAAGADILELGIPFSDPMAEGPVIQAAMERALTQHVTIHDVLAMVKQFRQQDDQTPIILMGYLNPLEFMGYEQFAIAAAEAGVDGTIIVDLPPEESDILLGYWQQNNLHPIFLCSPTTSNERMAKIAKIASGYLYYVSLKGVTGSGALNVSEVQQNYVKFKAQTKLPLLVGFGIKTPEAAAEIASFADGVVIGAALVSLVADYGSVLEKITQHASSMISNMRRAIDGIVD